MTYHAVREAEEQDKLLAAYRDDSKNLGNTVLVKNWNTVQNSKTSTPGKQRNIRWKKLNS